MRVLVRKGEFLLKCTFSVLFWKTVMISTLLNLVFFSRILTFFSVLALLLCTCSPGNIGPAKIFEQGNIAILICDIRGYQGTVTHECWLTITITVRFNEFPEIWDSRGNKIVCLGNEQKTDWRTKPLILGIKGFRTTTTCHFFFHVFTGRWPGCKRVWRFF